MKIASATALLLVSLTLGACSQRPEPAAAVEPTPRFQAVANIKQLMQAIVIPESDAVWGVVSAAPQDDAQWLALEHSALALAESGNLLMLPGRAIETEQWMRFSRDMTAAAVDALEGVRSRDLDRIAAAGDVLYESCEGCHQLYMPQAQEGV